jgi:hypothetical protein
MKVRTRSQGRCSRAAAEASDGVDAFGSSRQDPGDRGPNEWRPKCG